MADELVRAEPPAMPNILELVRKDPEAMTELQSRPNLARAGKGPRPSPKGPAMKELVRTSLALVERDPSQADLLLRHALENDSDPDELLIICKEVKPYVAKSIAELWGGVLNSTESGELRLRRAAALAAFAADDPRWAEAGEAIVPIILAANPFQQDSWTAAFRPVKSHL